MHMKKSTTIGLIIAAMIFVALLLTPTLVWDGGWAFECRFHILDSHNLWPVRDAKIRVVEESQLADFLNTNYAEIGRAHV